MSKNIVKMLVADDEAAIHAIFRHAVGRSALPLLLIETDNGRECMNILARGDIDLAFIDVFLPRMSDLEALSSARIVGSKTFVTLMSGRPDERCVELARTLKAYEFLLKPFRLSDVRAIIATFERVSRPLRVLIVDDSPTVRRLVRRVLERSIFRMQIEEAGGGETAPEICRQKTFDVIFRDCDVKGLHRLDALAELRERHEEAKVVMVSAVRNRDDEYEALARGAAAFLHKPLYPPACDALIHRMFGLRSPKLTITKARVLKDYDVTIVGTTVEVAHKGSGHHFQYLWYRDPPHLRCTHVEANAAAPVQPEPLRDDAEKAALLELKSARLVSANAQS